MLRLDSKEIKTIIKYLTAIRILFVIARKEHVELDELIKKLKEG